jgi:hypothetical protein
MTTTKNTTTATDLASEAKRAIETSPSYGPLKTAKEKLDDMTRKADHETEEVGRLVDERASGKSDTSERATDLLEGKAIADKSIDESLHAARRRLVIIREALAIQTRKVRDLEVKLSGEANAALRKLRQPLVDRMATALKELRAAAQEDGQICSELSRHRIIGGDRISFSPVGEMAFDLRWKNGVEAQGYTV